MCVREETRGGRGSRAACACRARQPNRARGGGSAAERRQRAARRKDSNTGFTTSRASRRKMKCVPHHASYTERGRWLQTACGQQNTAKIQIRAKTKTARFADTK